MVRAGFWSSKSLLSNVEVLGIMRKLGARSLATHLANFWIPTDRHTERDLLGPAEIAPCSQSLSLSPGSILNTDEEMPGVIVLQVV
jgi:hypothetical protein